MKKFYLILSLLGLGFNNLFAFDPKSESGCLHEKDLSKREDNWNLFVYSGYAWSKNAGITNPDPLVFTSVAPGDSDDSTLSNAPFNGVSLLRNANDWFTIGISYEVYGLFTYQRYHNGGVPASSSKREVIGSNYLRSFSLSHQSVLMEGFLKLPKRWRVMLGRTQIKPLLGGGVGVGIVNFFDFKTLSYDVDTGDTEITTIGSNNIDKDWAWRIETGINFKTIESNISFGISYRYYHGGKFSSGTRYQLNDSQNFGATFTLPAWTGTLKANELKMYIEIEFN